MNKQAEKVTDDRRAGGALRGQPKLWMRLALAVGILVSCIGCDQATKELATQKLRNQPPQTYLSGMLRLEFMYNSGGFLSLGSDLGPAARKTIFVVVNSVFMVLVLSYLVAQWQSRLAVFVPLAFLLAGGIGNLIDRTTQGGLVTDFINVGIGPLRTGVFNVADVAVMFSAIALVFTIQGGKGNGSSRDAKSETADGAVKE